MVKEMSFKRFLIWSFGSPPVWWSRTIYAILKHSYMEFGPVVKKEMSIKDFYLELRLPIC